MSGVMSALSNIGPLLTSAAPALSVAGTGANIFSTIQQFQEQSRLQGAQKYLTNLTENPTKMAAATASFEQPLNAGLVAGVGNTVQGTLAERGLGSSPAAYTSAMTQAIAPYVQQNQSTALNALMQSLGLLSNQKPTASGPQDISKLLAQLKIGGGGTGSTGFDSQLATTGNNLTLASNDPSVSIPDDTIAPYSGGY